MAKDVLRPGFQPLGQKAFEVVRSSGSVAINYNNLGSSCRACPPHRRAHLISIEFATLFIGRLTGRNLFPGFYTGDAFHITENNNTHKLPLLYLLLKLL